MNNLNKLDILNDLLEDEIMAQEKYNRHMVEIATPEVRQFFTQLRDAKMQHVTQLQKEIQMIMQQGKL